MSPQASLEVELQSIVRENEGDLLAFARKIYEHGYRQGLASRMQGQPEGVVSIPEPTAPELVAERGPLFPTRSRIAVASAPEEESGEPDESEAPVEEEAYTCDHRVRGSITVTGLQKKIERLFDLSRFAIDIVICRRGDPERRRLKSTVKLKNYLLEGE
jgi:hypothetical protein